MVWKVRKRGRPRVEASEREEEREERSQEDCSGCWRIQWRSAKGGRGGGSESNVDERQGE